MCAEWGASVDALLIRTSDSFNERTSVYAPCAPLQHWRLVGNIMGVHFERRCRIHTQRATRVQYQHMWQRLWSSHMRALHHSAARAAAAAGSAGGICVCCCSRLLPAFFGPAGWGCCGQCGSRRLLLRFGLCSCSGLAPPAHNGTWRSFAGMLCGRCLLLRVVCRISSCQLAPAGCPAEPGASRCCVCPCAGPHTCCY